jgi:hypothetical protein
VKSTLKRIPGHEPLKQALEEAHPERFSSE